MGERNFSKKKISRCPKSSAGCRPGARALISWAPATFSCVSVSLSLALAPPACCLCIFPNRTPPKMRRGTDFLAVWFASHRKHGESLGKWSSRLQARIWGCWLATLLISSSWWRQKRLEQKRVAMAWVGKFNKAAMFQTTSTCACNHNVADTESI